ncbi:MAG TPA: DNA polymerase III subunit delta, partial [Arenicellales bacterium]|nr:DNA polymerase III subunit delta [Arenicellales bacterium]
AGPDGSVERETISRELVDHARFNAFAAVDACLQGDTHKALRILKVLRNEGTEAVIVSWTFAREVRTLVRLDHGLRSGKSQAQLFKTHRIWSTRAPLVKTALSRLSASGVEKIIQQMARCDRVLKGRAAGDIWRELDALVLMMCGVRHAAEDREAVHGRS